MWAQLNHPTSSGGSLPCDAHRLWDAQQTIATFEIASQGGLAVPHDWTFHEALTRPLTEQQLQPVIDLMRAQRNEASDDHTDTYLIRLAILADFAANYAVEWSTRGRYGAAWVLIFSGVLWHGFVIRNGMAASDVLSPTSTFFVEHDNVQKLHRTLDLAFQPGRTQATVATFDEDVDDLVDFESDIVDGGDA